MYIPTIKYESEEHFATAMADHAYDIHMRTLYGIKEALRIKKDYVTIAYMETDDHVAEFGAPQDVWIDNLEKSGVDFNSSWIYFKFNKVFSLNDL